MESELKNQNGIRIRWLYRSMIAVTIVICAALILAALFADRSFLQLERATDLFVRAQNNCADMQTGSVYLTDRARTFVVTGDPGSAEDFSREVEVTRRRDLAVESMEELLSGSETAQYLGAALEASNQLAQIELYAMALAAAGYGTEPDSLPAAVLDIAISKEDASLGKEDQLSKAQAMLFDETYQSNKEIIRENIALCENNLVGETEAMRESSARQLQTALTVQTLFIILAVLAVAFVVLLNKKLVIDPINTMVKAIRENQPSEEKGAQELRIMSRTYNSSLAQYQQSQEALAYQADHDALTGLLNRRAFERARETTRGRAQALLIVDVDRFKQFNDTYGHDTGDRILQKVARALTNNFRDEDYLCRIGGDEFTVIMVHADSSMRPLVVSKVNRIREFLRDTSDGLPLITISVGAAFSDRPNPTDDILKDADTALYITKENGNDGCTFYGDKPKTQEDGKMLTIDMLKDFGANVEEGLGRCMNNEMFYLRLVKMASKDDNFRKLEEAVQAGDLTQAFEAAHALKGVMANLALTPIQQPVSEMTELLRARKEIVYGSYMKRITDNRQKLLELCKD